MAATEAPPRLALPRCHGCGPRADHVAGLEAAVDGLAGALREQVNSHAFKTFASGMIAGALTKTAVGPLETIRTRAITGGGKSMRGIFAEVLRTAGWRGLWGGNTINILRTAPSSAIELMTFEAVKLGLTAARKRERQRVKDGLHVAGVDGMPYRAFLRPSNLHPSGVAGAAAGLVSTFICYPLEVVKDRMTVNPLGNTSIRSTFEQIIETNGPMGLYRGLTPTLIGMLPYSAAYYYIYDMLKLRMLKFTGKKRLGLTDTMVIGGVAGVLSSASTFPLEVARKRLIVDSMSKSGRPYRNMADALTTIVAEEGFGGLYTGLRASCIKMLPASGLSWTFYEACKSILQVDGS
eukprot:SM000212S06919  [mRNA]  locus=s212:154521:156527:- [translate_table: standard]